MSDETVSETLVHLRPVKQASLRAGSTGQGAFRARQNITNDKNIVSPAARNTHSLYCDIQINCGKVLTKPANEAPIPNVTNKAGSAQQIKVPDERKRVRNAFQRFI